MAETEISVFTSANSNYQVKIILRQSGLFAIIAEKWTSDSGCDFWQEIFGHTLTDTFENAQKLALEQLSALSGDNFYPNDSDDGEY